MDTTIYKWALVACLCSASGIVLAQVPESTPLEGPASYGTATMPSDYTISSLDTLNIDIYDVPELSQGALQVDNSGMIAMPFIGRVQAAGLTTSQLSQSIAGDLDPKYVKRPIVTVTIKDAASQKITVDGDVAQPGVYEIVPYTTLTQAVSLAKGPTAVADIHAVSIVRLSSTGRSVTSYDLDAIHDGKGVDPFIQANDEVVVGTSGSRKFVRDFGSVIGLLTLLHP